MFVVPWKVSLVDQLPVIELGFEPHKTNFLIIVAKSNIARFKLNKVLASS